MPKATSVKPGRSTSGPRKTSTTDRKAAKLVESAQGESTRLRARANAEAARIREDAEEHARRLVLDARATADGVRAEGMEVVSNLRQISETLRVLAERVQADVEAIHARMVTELEGVEPDAAPAGEVSPERDSELDVPDFLAHG